MLEQSQTTNRSEVPRTVSSAQIHELKNRLTVIKGIGQLLGRQVRRPELERTRLEDRVTCLQNEVVRMEMLISEIARRDDVSVASRTHNVHAMGYSDD